MASMQEEHQKDLSAAFPSHHERKLSLLFFLSLGLVASTTVGFGSILVNILLLPAKLASLQTSPMMMTYSLIIAAGALAAVVSNPLTGALIDHASPRRKFFLAVGTGVFACAFLLLAQARTLIEVAFGVILAQAASTGMLYAALATMLLQVPLRQRAMASAIIGVSPLMGAVVGQFLATQVLHGNMGAATYLFLGITLMVLLPFALFSESFLSASASSAPRARRLPLWQSLGHTLRNRNFSWTWVTRFLVCLSYTTTVNYSSFYLGTTQQQLFFGVSVGMLVIAAFVTGKLSDHFQHRKMFVIGAGLAFGAGLVLLGWERSESSLLLASALFGIGYGAYQASDLALASQVLPRLDDGGRDLGFINAALFLPMMFAPVLALAVLALFHSYAALWILLAVGAWLASACICNVKTA